MAGAQDVEAGRAYVRLYLRRTDYDRQVDELKREGGDDRPSRAIASETELGVTIPATLAAAALSGAGSKVGSSLVTKMIPALRTVTKVSIIAAPALVSVSVAATATASSVASVGVAAATTAPVIMATAVAATAAAPAIASTGVAAAGAATGFAAMWVAAAPIVIPLAAIAAAAVGVYVALFKWDELPIIVKLLLVPLWPLVYAFKALKLAVSVITAPIWLTAAAIEGLKKTIRAIPGAITATIGLMGRLGTAAVEMAVKVTKAAATIPGRLARALSTGLRTVGAGIAKIGAVAAGITAVIVGPAILAAKSWAAYGETIRGIQNDLLKFGLTAEEASLIAKVSEATGESHERLARQIRDGTRDFSHWRNELELSGTLMSGAGLAAALALSRAYASLRRSVFGLKDSIAEALGPVLTETAELFSGMVRGVTRWVGENKPLIVQVFKIATAVGIAAGVITTLGGAIVGVGAAVSPFVAWMALLAGVMAAVEMRTEAGQSLWSAYGESVRRVADTVMRSLGDMMEFADRVFGGVADALIAGDIALAVEVMWNAAKVAWISGLLEIDELTDGTFSAILQSLAAGEWKAAGEALVGVLTEVWINIVGAADTAWVGVLSGFDTLVDGMKSGLAGFLGWAVDNVFKPLAVWINQNDTIFGIESGAGKIAHDAIKALNNARKDAETALKDRPAGVTREDELAARQQAREVRITALRERQAELAKQSGEQAERERTANQNALDASLAAAEAARAAAAENKLKEEDFAVSQDIQSITRFSGEALGLSIGRGDDPARKAVKVAEDQLREFQGLREEIVELQEQNQRILAMGGFQ